MLSLSSPVSAISGVGPAIAKKLNKLRIYNINDLLLCLPTRYEDYSRLLAIKDLKVGERVTIKGKIQLINSRRSFRRRLSITEALVTDGTGTIKAVWFNQPYLTQTLKSGSTILLAGKLGLSNYGLQLEQPAYEHIAQSGLHTGRLVPYYALSGQLSHHFFRNLISKAIGQAKYIPDWLPSIIKQKAALPSLSQAIVQLHFPQNKTNVLAARKRMVFDELYLINLQAKLAKQAYHSAAAPIIPYSQETKSFVAHLPWQLTNDQKQAAWQIIQDLGKAKPMFRLLQGDVGSGKTIVAGIAALNVTQAGWQVALLAPTEILAEQHFSTLSDLFKNYPINIALLTGHQHAAQGPLFPPVNKLTSKITAAKIKKALAAGDINIIIGTHSLLQKGINFAQLGFVVVDEQHRFGVEQRRHLINDKTKLSPHFLSLSATPIPRSLALSIFGDLDISLLKSLPAGRQAIITKITPPAERPKTYNLIRQEVNKGNRVFIICPLIDENDEGGVRAATTEYEALKTNIFTDINIGLLHGRLPSRQKVQVMNSFKSGAAPILVSTSVVEVGIDVPEATIMAIEGAERFGVAQLHQFRGRVGRSDKLSYCLLFTDNETNFPKRLEALVKYQNGFDLAEFDLAERGPGSLLGDIQSGYLRLKYADLVNTELLATVRKATDYTLALDPNLTRWPEIKQKLGNIDFHPE